MPRSNKTKKWLQPPPRSPTECTSSKTLESILIKKERQLMIDRGKASAKKHGIALDSGSFTSADGNCAFSAALANVNQRSCFKEKFQLTL